MQMDNFKKYQVNNYRVDYMYIKDIKWDNDGLKINLESEKYNNKINLIFDNTVYLYLNTAEAYKPSSWIEIEDSYYPFYYSDESEYINKLKEDVDHIEDDKIIHFVIIGVDNTLDVLTSDFPKINIE